MSATPGNKAAIDKTEASAPKPVELSTCCICTGRLALQYGQTCPYCLVGKVDYNSRLELVCENCGKTQTGAFT